MLILFDVGSTLGLVGVRNSSSDVSLSVSGAVDSLSDLEILLALRFLSSSLPLPLPLMPAKLAGCLKPLVLALDGFNLLILMMLQGLVSERPLVLSALAAFVLVLPLRAGIADLILDMVKGVSGVAESFVDVGVTGELVERLRPRVVLLRPEISVGRGVVGLNGR
jgi:hypothetical protein